MPRAFSAYEKPYHPRRCCESHSLKDLRTCGLVKTEIFGTEIVALCSKSYVAASDKCIKYSMKNFC